MVTSRTTSPAFYEERLRLLEAENQRLRDALKWISANDERGWFGDRARAALDGTPSAAQTLEDVTPDKEKAGS